MNKKIAFLAVLGSIFLFSGIYFANPAFAYLGAGTWLAGLIYFTLFAGFKEITSIILGLLVLHAGVVMLLKENTSNMKLLGFMIFTIGIVFVLNSGFSDYLKKKKMKP